MPRKAKTEETVVTEETVSMEAQSEETETTVEDALPAEEESPVDEKASADADFSSDDAIRDGDGAAAEETYPTGETVESGDDISGGTKLQTEDSVDAGSVKTEGDESAKASETAPDISPETGDENGSGAANNAPEASNPTKKRKTKASAPAAKPEPPVRKPAPSAILTLNADTEVETQESREDTIWHELQNAYRTRRILTGSLGGIEKMDGGGTIAVVYYKEMRVVIPLAEMMINLVEDEAHDYGELVQRQNKILGNMLGCEIDFIIKGLDNASRSVVASRKDAMYKKRQIFYMPDADGSSRVCEDRIVQARVIAVAEKVVRVEIFGTECSILARDLSWDWLGDATEHFHVGDQILVRILSVKIRSLEDISVKADVKSVNGNTSKENLGKCKIQGKYAGTVTDIHKGTVFVRLHIGVNAVAHSCYDNRLPGKKDEVSFVVTRIDADRNVAVGLISRIIKQNI